MLAETQNKFSLTRGAYITCRLKKAIPISSSDRQKKAMAQAFAKEIELHGYAF
jgi:hypothetical protein